MADEEQLAILRQGSEAWNAWRQRQPDTRVELREAKLATIDLAGADLSRANLRWADLRGANLRQASLRAADLRRVDLSSAHLCGADLGRADLGNASLCGADLTEVNLSRASLVEANLTGADLTRANLSRTNLAQALLANANLVRCCVYGMSAWDMDLDGAHQVDLIITKKDQSEVTVDNLEVAQFIYLLLNNKRVRDVIDTVTSKAVLILGRFTPERKAVLDALRAELRRRDYLPILFDFDKPNSKDLTGTVQTLANMARFIIADLTNPSSVPHELAIVVPGTVVPVQPILLEGQSEYAMFVDLRRRYHWVLEPYCYADIQGLLTELGEQVIGPAETKAQTLRAA